jgi:hypothetical protein
MLFAIGFGCGRSRTSSLEGAGEPKGGCGHAVCEDDFVVDAIAPVDCSSGERCQMTVKLVALGDNRVNDEYRFRFVADQKPLVQFSGTDPAGQTIFSKAAGDWRKDDAKSGAMAVNLFVSTPGNYTITGTLELSVCSGPKCVAHQRRVSATFTAN